MRAKLYEEIEGRLRGLVRRFKPRTVNDAGEMQTASGTTLHGEHRADVEILQPYGFNSVPPKGSLMVVFAVGGDQGDLVGIPAAAPSKRMGKLKPGESALYGPGGARVHMKQDGSIAVQSAVKVFLKAPEFEFQAGGVTVKITAAGVEITGGTVKHDGKNIGSTHTHGGVIPGGGSTSVPN